MWRRRKALKTYRSGLASFRRHSPERESLEDHEFDWIWRLANKTGYSLQTEDWHLLIELHAMWRSLGTNDIISINSETSEYARGVIDAHASDPDHAFWSLVHFMRFCIHDEVLQQIRDDCYEELFSQAYDPLNICFEETYIAFNKLADILGYALKDEDVYVLIELITCLRHDRLDEEQPRLTRVGAWDLVKQHSSNPTHNFRHRSIIK